MVRTRIVPSIPLRFHSILKPGARSRHLVQQFRIPPEVAADRFAALLQWSRVLRVF